MVNVYIAKNNQISKKKKKEVTTDHGRKPLFTVAISTQKGDTGMETVPHFGSPWSSSTADTGLLKD